MQGIGNLFIPLEEVIREQFIPALIGRQVSEMERRLLALPYKHGGLGKRNPVLNADAEYSNSVEVTRELTHLICEQETDLSKLDEEKVAERKHLILSKSEGSSFRIRS